MKKMLLCGICLFAVTLSLISCEGRANRVTPLSDTMATEEQTAPVTVEIAEPYFSAADDADAYPAAHTEDMFPADTLVSEDYRFYAATPVTDSEAFNAFCRKTVASIQKQYETAVVSRTGGSTVVTLDYRFFKSAAIYSCVFLETEKTVSGTKEDVSVLIFDTEAETVYSPLDVYDADSGYADALASAMRAGFLAEAAARNVVPDTAYLDSVCAPEPSCFVNIACDDGNLYFFHAFPLTDSGEETRVLCSVVEKDVMTPYRKDISVETEAAVDTEPAVTEKTAEPVAVEGAVPLSEAVDDTYFEDALFIGNSLIVGFQKTSRLPSRFFASIGLNVKDYFRKEVVPLTNGKSTTVDHAVSLVDYEKVYLMFGINELGWGSIDAFLSYYEQIIDSVRREHPTAVVYVQSILPINEEKWAKSQDYQSCINNVSVVTFNEKLKEMCERKQAYYVNVWEALLDPETGELYADATSDGIHIGYGYAANWVEYLKTHTVTQKAE